MKRKAKKMKVKKEYCILCKFWKSQRGGLGGASTLGICNFEEQEILSHEADNCRNFIMTDDSMDRQESAIRRGF